MSKLPFLVILFFSLIVYSCGGSENHEDEQKSAGKMNAVSSSQDEATAETMNRKLIKKGVISFATTDMESTRNKIKDAIQRYNGYVSKDVVQFWWA